jgi:hypothetical protein
MESKPAVQSKTVWVALIVAVAAFLPVVKEWIAGNPGIFAQVIAGVFFVLRLVTKGKISIS